MNRDSMLHRARGRREPWDLLVIGGGATGVGMAVDAATRGYAVLLLEGHDFGKGTSSRSTKLVHGGVRYLERGDVGLVREALRERGRLRRNAPHLVHERTFVLPCYQWWERPFYAIGLTLYDLLSGRHRLGRTRGLSAAATRARMPNLRAAGLRGSVVYSDGQFDDARLLINLVTTAAEHGATLVNYAPVIGLTRDAAGRVDGVRARDSESGDEFTASARVVVNATGAFCDGVRKLADAAASPIVAPSQGIHLVFDRSFLPGDDALIVPKTADGRVMFAIPWHGRTLVGTTDVAIADTPLEPRATDAEIDFVLATTGRYLERAPTRADILSTFAGIRPLVKHAGQSTAKMSREHAVVVEAGMLTITGGKWTTYRAMAEDGVTRAAELAGLPPRPCVTGGLHVHGYAEPTADALSVYGSDAAAIRADARHAERLHPALPVTAAEVAWAARAEMARTVEDVLARRTRALFLDARAAVAMAPKVAEVLAEELSRDAAWRETQLADFAAVAAAYLRA